MKPGEMQGMLQKPQSHDENFLSWLHDFLLNHVSLGWGAARKADVRIRKIPER